MDLQLYDPPNFVFSSLKYCHSHAVGGLAPNSPWLRLKLQYLLIRTNPFCWRNILRLTRRSIKATVNASPANLQLSCFLYIRIYRQCPHRLCILMLRSFFIITKASDKILSTVIRKFFVLLLQKNEKLYPPLLFWTKLEYQTLFRYSQFSKVVQSIYNVIIVLIKFNFICSEGN